MEWERGRRAITNQNLHELHIQKHGYFRDFKTIWSLLSLDNILESSGLREEEANVQPTKSKRRQTGQTQVNWLWHRDQRALLSKDRMLLTRICLRKDLKVPSSLDHQAITIGSPSSSVITGSPHPPIITGSPSPPVITGSLCPRSSLDHHAHGNYWITKPSSSLDHQAYL